MSCLGNILWFILGGFLNSIGWLLTGVLWCITLVGIPIGIQCFKMAKLQLAPFGKEIITTNDGIGNFILNIFSSKRKNFAYTIDLRKKMCYNIIRKLIQ